MKPANRYEQLIETVFLAHYTPGAMSFCFDREEFVQTARQLRIALPKNPGDVIYTFRYRCPLPEAVRKTAPSGSEWVIRPAGRGKYRFETTTQPSITPNPSFAETKVPDGTPGMVARYALSDEQALLAILRYNRLIDVFTGIACYSLQSHLRTAVKGMGQVETDEMYVGVDKRGVHYVVPVQAKGGKDRLNVVQIEQDIAVCHTKFPGLICRPIGAQFVEGKVIAMFELETGPKGLRIVCERHYRLVPPNELTVDELRAYQARVSE